MANRYATLFYSVFDNAKRTLEWLDTSGAPVGMFTHSTYEEKIVELGYGDLVLAYTDGVIETTNQNGEEWGVQGLLKAAVYGVQLALKVGHAGAVRAQKSGLCTPGIIH